MQGIYRYVLYGFLLAITFSGCSGGNGHSLPLLPGEPSPTTDLTSTAHTEASRGSHSLWFFNFIYVDASNPDQIIYETIPVRQVTDHFNVLGLLEQKPCTDCFKITGIEPSGADTYLVDIEITHPFDNANLTAFDVRGIAMFDASLSFLISGLTLSVGNLGDCELLNADGYTSLYNCETAGSGSNGLEGYIHGKYATTQIPDATLNGYKRHVSNDPFNTRNAFYAGDSVTATYEVYIPETPFVFGYAVDANWAMAINKPVSDPMIDFGPEANCPEAWKIVVTEEPVGDGLTDCGGKTKLIIDIYDWQGKDDTYMPSVICSPLFDWMFQIEWKEDGDGFTRYEALIENVNMPAIGTYRCLIRKQASENDPATKPWLDLTAYQVINLEVIEHPDHPPTAIVEADNYHPYAGVIVNFDPSDSHDNDCDEYYISKFEWDFYGDGNFINDYYKTKHAWDEAGIYEVQLRVTDDEGSTDELDTPLVITVEENPVNMKDVTPPWLGYLPEDIVVEGSYAYIAAGVYGLLIFDISDPSDPFWVNRVDTSGEFINIDVYDGYAYVAEKESGCIQAIDIDPPEAAHVVNGIVLDGRAWDVVISDGYAYAIDDDNFHVIDIDTPESAHIINSIQVVYDTSTSVFLRDLAVDGDYAYVIKQDSVDSGNDMHIIDIHSPDSLDIVNEFTIKGAGIEGGLAVSDGYAYVTYCYEVSISIHRGVGIYDVDPPGDACCVGDINAFKTSLDIDIFGNYLYFTESIDCLKIYDITSPDNAIKLSSKEFPGCDRCVTASDGYAYVAGESGIRVIDVSTPDSPIITGGIDATGYARGVAVSGDYAYVANESLGVQIVDISAPDMAGIINTVETPEAARAIAVSGEYAYVSDYSADFHIIDIDPPEDANIINTLVTSGSSRNIAVSDGYAYVANYQGGVQIIDIDPPESAHVIKTFETLDYASLDIVLSGNYAYVADFGGSLYIIDIESPEDAYVLNSFEIFGNLLRLDISNGYVFATGFSSWLVDVFDVDPPEDAHDIGTIKAPEYATDIKTSGNYMYVSYDYSYYAPAGLALFDISDPENAYIINVVDTPDEVKEIAVSGNYVYLADEYGGLRIIETW